MQIITIHRSKGLEFPIVYVPFGWDRNVRDPDVPLLHDERGRRVLDVGGETGEGWKERCARHRAEEAGEDLRLLYVALTRAQCQVVALVGAGDDRGHLAGAPAAAGPSTGSPRPGRTGRSGRRCSSPPSGTGCRRTPRPRPRCAPGPARRSPSNRWARPVPVAPAGPAGAGIAAPLRAATLRPGAGHPVAAHLVLRADRRRRRTTDRAWRSEPEDTGTDDEVEVAAGRTPAAPDRPPGPPSPLAGFPLGAAFGTLVHAVLEVADLTAPDLPAELAAHCAEQLRRGPVPGVDPDALAAALLPVAHTPLGPLAGGLRLADIAPADRLAELDFELPLAGGDGATRMCGLHQCRPHASDQAGRATAELTLGDLVPLLRRHLPPDDPLAGYPAALAAPGLADQPLRGYLTGSIDAVLRLPGPRFAIVDYKTNWLGPLGGRRAADRRALHRTAAGRGHDRGELPAAGPAVRRGAAPVPALAAARLRPAAAPGRGALPVRARHVRAGHPGGARGAVRGVQLDTAARADRRAVAAAGSGHAP